MSRRALRSLRFDDNISLAKVVHLKDRYAFQHKQAFLPAPVAQIQRCHIFADARTIKSAVMKLGEVGSHAANIPGSCNVRNGSKTDIAWIGRRQALPKLALPVRDNGDRL